MLAPAMRITLVKGLASWLPATSSSKPHPAGKANLHTVFAYTLTLQNEMMHLSWRKR
jgi:hypothetical protein